MLCHTGLVWEATVAGGKLTFHLAGVNNQNFIMRDEETGSWWQQVTGEAIAGPMKEHRLQPVFHDELTFATWKREQPTGRVLRPHEPVAEFYEPANWEEEYAKRPVVTPVDPADAVSPRALVVGISLNGAAKAYPIPKVQRDGLVLDTLGGVPLMIVIGDDKKSVRVFERTVDGRELEFFVKVNTTPLRWVDAETGSEWDFLGQALSGPLTGRRLRKIAVLTEFWFDWKKYHPDTEVY
jgi:hypothetical protein